ncbi:MAG: hypothetical protein QXN15_10265 [Candidatus Jordarchaeales archaeon]|nr:hypothetical protein [Candidatus Jordarchaeia archaeon]
MESEGKFKQPWRGVLSLLTIYGISYTAYAVFLNPTGGLLSRIVVGNAFLLRYLLEYAVSKELAALLAPVLALRSAEFVAFNPLGYPLDWMSVVVFGIVWFIAIAVLCAPLQRTAPPKQPRTGLIVAALSLILAFATFWVLGSVFKMTGYEMLLLGTCGFLVFPVWATLFNYWPFVPKKPDMHPVARGAIYTALSWAIAAALYYVFNTLAWRGAVFFDMYTLGHDLFTTLLRPLFPFNHYDKWMSLLVAVILGCNIVGLVNPFEKKSQPVRGVINLVIAAVIGVALWLVLTPILGKAPHVSTITIEAIVTVRIPLVVTVSSPGNVTVYLLYVILSMLIIRHVFEMHWFAGKGTKGNVLAVASAFVAGTLLFFATTAITPVAVFLSGADAAMCASGLQAITYDTVITYIGYALGLRWYAGPMLLTAMSYMLEAQAAVQHLAVTLTFGWFVLASIMWLLIYLSFDHWPWK